jgi:hypothetical protein
MGIKSHLLTTEPGITHTWEDNQDGTFTVHSEQDVEALLDRNKAMATHNDGYSPTREWRRVASIPMILINKWLQEEGWNALDPQCAHKVAEKLNSSEYMFLRTAPGKL